MDGDLKTALCRDCFTHLAGGRRCPHCYGPRLLANPELFDLSIAHLDCDAFYATIEKHDDPAIAGSPVIVGGGRRGVVAAACYLARTYGVHSAMPMFEALRRCPDAVVLRPRMNRYREVSRAIRSMMEALTPAVEPLALDEAFLDLSGTERLHGCPPAEALARLAKRIEDDIGIPVSIGLSHNKFLAKIASDLKKPRGFAVIGRAETRAFLARHPVSLIPGVGKATLKALAADGIASIAQLQEMEEETLLRRYGAMGGSLYRLSRGIDERRVVPNRPAKSLSAETTFERDIGAFEALEPILWRQCERLSRALKEKRLAARTVTLKLKTARHRTLTRSRRLDSPTQLADRLFEIGRSLLRAECGAGLNYRLLGIGGAALVDEGAADDADLVDPSRARRAAAEHAVDRLRARFGESSVIKGRSL